MNVLFITSWFPSRVHPTNGNFIGRHARLVARAHQVVVVALEIDEDLPFGTLDLTRRTENGYEVIQVYVGYKPGVLGPIKVLLRLRAYAKALSSARQEFGVPDLIHGQVLLDGGMLAALYSRLWDRPFVLTEHSSAYHKAGALGGFRGWLGHYASRRAKMIMPVSDHLGRSMKELNGLEGSYRTVSNVVNAELYHQVPPPDMKPFRLLHVSNFDEAPKNISGLLRAFNSLEQEGLESPITLHLAGDGDLRALQEMIDAMDHPGVSCSGPHSEGEIAELMQGCHAFVLFSNYENQPVVLLEAQMSGRPCIATPVGGIPDIVVAGKTGLLVPVGNEPALTQAIVDLCEDYKTFDLSIIRERAFDRYSEAAVMKSLNEVYSEAVM